MYNQFQFLQLPKKSVDKKLANKLSKYQMIYSTLGLIGGIVCIFGGIYLFILGISGNISWITKITGIESNISNAAPGAILFIVGLFIIWITKFKVKLK